MATFNIKQLEKKYMVHVLTGKITPKQAKTMLSRAKQLNLQANKGKLTH